MAVSLDFRSCDELDPELIERAFAPGGGSPRDQVLKLVEKMARVAKPGRGAHRILEVLARLAQSAWVEGALDVVLRDFGLATEIDIRVDVGRHLERLRTVSVAVPLAELADWAADNPAALTPLVVFDTRRDDELRLRKATSRVSQIPRSSAPVSRPSSAGASPAAPAAEVARRPIAAANRKSVRPAPPPRAQARDVHRRDTPRMLQAVLPRDAFRSLPDTIERKPTVRIPVVRPQEPPSKAEPDPTDEGWE